MKLPAYPKDAARLAAVPLIDGFPFGPLPLGELPTDMPLSAFLGQLPRLDLIAELPCPEIEYAVAHSLPLPHMPAEVPGIAQLKLKRRKASYYARRSNDDVFREDKRIRTAEWARANPEKKRAKKKRERDDNYYRPFVAIDSEGINYPYADDGILIRERKCGPVAHIRHDTFLWGAAADDGRPPNWLKRPDTAGLNKRPLGTKETFDWLLSLPEHFGPAWFVMFASGYDMCQLLKNLPWGKAYQLFKRETLPDANGVTRKIERGIVLWDEYAISWFPGKFFNLWLLKDPQSPYDGEGRLQSEKHIRIHDVFGFFQTGFTKIASDMAKRGEASEIEAHFIEMMKARRGEFENETVEQIQEYTTYELRLLARIMGGPGAADARSGVRGGLDNMGLRLQGWHGAGAASSALIKTMGVRQHYGPDISADAMPPQQEAAHHAFFGGRIELIKQGYRESGGLHFYDIASAYPAAMAEFPSLARWAGCWTHKGDEELRYSCLPELRAAVERASVVSMFKLRFQFPEYVKYHADPIRAEFVPLFPLPYRTRTGGILFPSRGYGWYMRDDILGAIAWLERFAPDYPRKGRRGRNAVRFEFEEAWLFEQSPAGRDVRPFAFIGEWFNQRRQIKERIQAERDKGNSDYYDIREMVIKLTLNSMYGKMAQAIGAKGKIPPIANPYFAAATTAYCRRRALEAALVDPAAIVQFSTDGLVSTRALHGPTVANSLARVKEEGGKDQDGKPVPVDLGDWEYKRMDGGIFVQSGIYSYFHVRYGEDGKVVYGEPVSKLRGGSKANYKDADIPWLVQNALAEGWRRPNLASDGAVLAPVAYTAYPKFMTIGACVGSPDEWRLAGRWTPSKDAEEFKRLLFLRTIDIHNPGGKRQLIEERRRDYVTLPDMPSRRCFELIETRPAPNSDAALSRSATPDWYSGEFGEEVREMEELAAIGEGFN